MRAFRKRGLWPAKEWVLWAAAVFFLASCGRREPPAAEQPPPEVTVATALVREVVEWDEFTGRLAAVDSVEIRARVSGYLQSIHFTDGQIVKKGDLLFVIDPRPYAAALDAAQAESDRLEARAALARNDLIRAEQAAKDLAISAEELDRRAKAVAEEEAAARAARANVEQAKLNVEFTEVRAPIDGRISRHQVSIGNLISGGTSDSTLLTTVVSLDPIHCYFDADEQMYLRYTRMARRGERPSSRDVANPVLVSLADEKDFTHQGRMDFVDNRMDLQTGTMRGRAILDNPDRFLVPGLFVRLRLPGSGKHNAVLIPDAAVGTDQATRFVLVVNDQSVVEQHRVTLGRIIDGLRVVATGLKGGERIIVKGLQRVRPGAKVRAVESDQPPPVPSPSADPSPPHTPAAEGKSGSGGGL